jgi:hypothetical protein
MRRFRVLELIVLGFEDGRMQCDAYVDRGDELEFDGSTIWAVWTAYGKKAESLNISGTIEVLLQRGVIEEIL